MLVGTRFNSLLIRKFTMYVFALCCLMKQYRIIKAQTSDMMICWSVGERNVYSARMVIDRWGGCHSLYCLFVMLFPWPFVFLNPIGFDIKPLSMKFSFILLSPSNNYYLSLRIHTKQEARVLVTHSTTNENWHCKWKWRQHDFTSNVRFSQHFLNLFSV